MAGGMQGLDLNFPRLEDGQDDREALERVVDYLYILLENLKFLLSNLGVNNFNDKELENLTAPVYRSIGDIEKGLLEVKATAEGASVTASDAQGAATQAQLTANGAQITAQNAAGQAVSLAFTVDGLTVRNPDGSTTIDGNKIKSGTIEGVTLISEDPWNGARMELLNGFLYFSDNPAVNYGQIGFDLSERKVYLQTMPGIPLKIMSAAGLSIDADNAHTLYLGTYNGGCNVDIGYEGKDIHLYGNVYINGVLQG